MFGFYSKKQYLCIVFLKDEYSYYNNLKFYQNNEKDFIFRYRYGST